MSFRPTRPNGARLLQYSLLAGLLLAALAATACQRLAEPTRDVDAVAALETLAARTAQTFADVAARPGPARHAERTAQYAALDAAAQDASAGARARATPVQRESTDRYAVATAGFLADYRAHLALLAGHDAERAGLGLAVDPRIVALREAAMTDALGDALFYERDALDRR